MLDFICILLIFFEIIFTVFCVKKLCEITTRVDNFHIKMLEKAKRMFEIIDEIRNIVSKINKVTRIINNKKFQRIRRILMMSLDVIQIILFIKSLKLSNGIKSIDLDLLKKLVYARVGQKLLNKGLDFLQNLCAI